MQTTLSTPMSISSGCIWAEIDRWSISGEALIGYAMVPALLAAGGGQDRPLRARPRATPAPAGPGTRPARRRGRRRQP